MRKENIKYAILQMVFWTTAASCYAFMTQILEAKGFGSSQIGILNAVKLLATVVFQMAVGSAADKYAKKVPLKTIIALLAGAATAFTAVFYFGTLSFIGTLLLFIGFGATFTCISPLIDSLSVLYNDNGMKINYAFGRAAGSAAYAVASVGLGIFCDRFGGERLLLLQIIFTFMILVMALFMENMPKQTKNHLMNKSRAEQKVHSVGYLLWNYPKFTCFLVGSAVMFMGYNLGTTFLIHVIEEAGGTNAHYGVAEFVMAISEVPAAFLIVRCRGKIPMEKVMIGCAFFMALKNVFAAYSESVAIIILSQGCEMLGFGMFYAGSVYIVDEMLPKTDIVKGMSFINAATVGLGEGIGSFFCGFLRDELGLHGLMEISVLVGAVSSVCMFFMNWLPRERKGVNL